MTMVLAIDTATDYAGLALYDGQRLWAEEIWFAARNHSVELGPRLKRMLAVAKISVSQLGGIAVSIGPGSYTGVRVGVALAKGLAMPHQLATVGVPTLDIVAYPHRYQTLPVVAVAQAGRKRLLVAHYAWVDQIWTQIQPPYLTDMLALTEVLTNHRLVVGELSEGQRQILKQNTTSNIQVTSPVHGARRPAYMAELGAIQIKQQTTDDLVPIYIKDP